MIERVLGEDIEPNKIETIIFGGVEFPRFLVTKRTFQKKLEKIEDIKREVKEELVKGTPDGGVGDRHGQFHSQLIWYRDQEHFGKMRYAVEIGEGLEKAIIIEDYEKFRNRLKDVGIAPIDKVTLGSRLKIQYGSDPEDVEWILVVAPLDGGAEEGWVSVETPLAKSIENKKAGEAVEFEVNNRLISVKIISVE